MVLAGRCAPIIGRMDTMTPQQRIEADVKAAMKAGKKEDLSTLRMLLTEIKNERIRRQAEVDEDAFVSLVRKAIKQREEAAAQFHKGGRAELAAKEESEKAFLATYLPAQVDEAQIRAAIAEVVAARGLSGPAAIGPIMKEMLARFGSAADGATINRLAREALTAR
ncbi:MAG TPA: glutamyl-tRNA amidotransferase [Acidobacteria bacterium]|nr:glutamyl-tRNA amidotransferase [Acidobacteriota bacterium]